MSRSSSSSWSRDDDAAPNIIDLDKIQRKTVRSSRFKQYVKKGSRLVVDSGAVDRKIKPMPIVTAVPMVNVMRTPMMRGSRGDTSVSVKTSSCSSSIYTSQHHKKRFSHDSGLSDGSYKPKTQRSPTGNDISKPLSNIKQPNGLSKDSLQAFRNMCEKALLEQQQQISRVTQLCERLTKTADTTSVPRSSSAARPSVPKVLVPTRSLSPQVSGATSMRTSETTTTSRSSRPRDKSWKDKQRGDECRTYKIIMNKLDDLNRMFDARARAGNVTRYPHQRCYAPFGTVTVLDKVIATGSELKLVQPSQLSARTIDSVVVPLNKSQQQTTTAFTSQNIAVAPSAIATKASSLSTSPILAKTKASRDIKKVRDVREVTNTCKVDIAPTLQRRDNIRRPNIVTETVVASDSEPNMTTEVASKFDLDDPIHLYSQAKRLKPWSKSSRPRRSHSIEAPLEIHISEQFNARISKHSSRQDETSPRLTTICSLCRGYWRSIRQYVATQLLTSATLKAAARSD